MCYYTVIIPKKGRVYMKSCKEYNDGSEGYDLSAKSIGISHPDYRLRVLVDCQFQDLFSFRPANARIYAIEEFPRDKFAGLEEKVAQQIVDTLNQRRWPLWDKPPADY